MNTNIYLKMLREIKSVSISTVDESFKPNSRIIDIILVEENKIFFVTARGKNFAKQLLKNPNISISALTKAYQMIRINGKIKKVERDWMKKIVEQNSIIKQIYPRDTIEILDPFCVYEGEGTFFDLTNHPPKTLAFGVGETTPKLFRPYITKKCIECGICKNNCPSNCIKEGKPYSIETLFCLNCGLCMEKCPSHAIMIQGVVE